MAIKNDPGLLQQLYNMQVGAIPKGIQKNPPNYWAEASENALKTYRELMQEGSGVTSVRPRLAPPVLPSPSSGLKVGVGVGGKGMVPGTTGVTLPTYDTGKVEGLAQRFAAPGIRNLRSAVQATQQGVYENPNVGAMTVRQALQGYGAGLEDVMAGALKSGIAAYGQEYNPQVTKALTEFGASEARALQTERMNTERDIAEINARNRRYSQYYDDYLKSLT